jgi:hypothetical protein
MKCKPGRPSFPISRGPLVRGLSHGISLRHRDRVRTGEGRAAGDPTGAKSSSGPAKWRSIPAGCPWQTRCATDVLSRGFNPSFIPGTRVVAAWRRIGLHPYAAGDPAAWPVRASKERQDSMFAMNAAETHRSGQTVADVRGTRSAR